MTTGKIKWFNPTKGYGFIEQEGKDVFLHVSALEEAGIDTLKEGEEIEFEIGEIRERKTQLTLKKFNKNEMGSNKFIFTIVAHYNYSNIKICNSGLC